MGIARHADVSPFHERAYPGPPGLRPAAGCRMLVGNGEGSGETPEGRGFPHPVSFIPNRSMWQSTSTLCLTPIAPPQASANMQYTTNHPFVNSPHARFLRNSGNHAFRLWDGYVLTMGEVPSPLPLSIAGRASLTLRFRGDGEGQETHPGMARHLSVPCIPHLSPSPLPWGKGEGAGG